MEFVEKARVSRFNILRSECTCGGNIITIIGLVEEVHFVFILPKTKPYFNV